MCCSAFYDEAVKLVNRRDHAPLFVKQWRRNIHKTKFWRLQSKELSKLLPSEGVVTGKVNVRTVCLEGRRLLIVPTLNLSADN